jgi:ubiquinone/menaquinone biosynthesis C-methylase UbiE/uncharacterized protein YbaR (Trm112 family)
MREEPFVCPLCKGRLAESQDALSCVSCGSEYPRVEGVPVLLPESLSGQQQSQTQYFDSEFARYRRGYAPENWRLSFIQRIFRAVGVREGRGPYLDVGVGGSGATVIEAARLGVEATGCDLSVEGVVHAQRTAHAEGVDARARFVACTAETLPFADASFGCASAVAVLEHLEDDAAAARELARVVRPGGLVWLTVPLAYRYMLPPLWPVYLRHDRKLGHLRHYDEAGLMEIAGAAGFRHVATSYTGHAVKVAQFVLDRVRPLSPRTRTSLWWKLERLDLRAQRRPWGALQLNVVVTRA